VVAALSFSVPAYRFGPREDEYTAAILDAARRISENASPTL
jgi:DNA-binding IclR family transcriptional regulator